MNPRLNPDLVKDEANLKDHLAEPAEVRLPVTNSIYGRPIESTAVPDLPATNGRHTTHDENQITGPETYGGQAATRFHAGGNTDTESAERTKTISDPGDEAPTEMAQSEQSSPVSSTRDSGTAMMTSPYLTDLVGKTSSDQTPSDTMLDVPHVQEHARADSSTIGNAETGRYSGSNYDTQAIESTDGEDETTDDVTLTATTEGFGVGVIPGGFPDASEEALVAASEEPNVDQHPASGAASTFNGGTAAAAEPLMDDALLDVSDEYKPAALNQEGSSEPLISDEQLGVDDEFRPQTKM